MHPLFFAALVVAIVLAIGSLALALIVSEPAPRRRRRPTEATQLPAWMDLDGSARRATARRRSDGWPALRA